jgi:hypothetical protein
MFTAFPKRPKSPADIASMVEPVESILVVSLVGRNPWFMPTPIGADMAAPAGTRTLLGSATPGIPKNRSPILWRFTDSADSKGGDAGKSDA